MPSPTYVPIAKSVLTTTQSSVTFSGISGTYTDLILLISARSNHSAVAYDAILVQINSLTSGNTYTELVGYTTGVLTAANQYGSSKNLLGWTSTAGTTSNTFGSAEIYLPNYSGNYNKVLSSSAVSENNATTSEAAYTAAVAGLLSNTVAISSLTLNCFSGSFVSGSRFDLYGIKNS
jgi:hypothetical protein